MKHSKDKIKGFTLLELLVALAIFSVLSVMAYGSLQTVISTKTASSETSDRLAKLQLLMLRISNDLRQVSLRKIRDEYGDSQPVMKLHQAGNQMLEWSRAGYMNPAKLSRSQLQRVAYRIEDEKLIRMSWHVLDRAQDTEAVESELIDDVIAIEWRFLKDDDEWATDWPEDQQTNPDAIPLAIEFNIELKDWGKLTRLVLLPEAV